MCFKEFTPIGASLQVASLQVANKSKIKIGLDLFFLAGFPKHTINCSGHILAAAAQSSTSPGQHGVGR